ncbi:replicative DNA helicase [Christiangramia fulva]|uniref:Replicative DNA helicase n=1 Tax=Christiangramia fulva TaxID=2126553 RepID=A0A2R3ZAC7_9FLAO|nr:replicative DNA helicase [Christiangramia fulva]AVR47235.1 replicative DNA helicase [Christiangramia fulva]
MSENITYKKNDAVSLVKGKIPPQAVDLEEVILGALMIDKKGLDEIMDFMKPEMFYKTKHKTIFKIIRKLYQNDDDVDLLTVSDELKKEGSLDKVGGDYYLIELTQKVSSSAHIQRHARIVFQEYIKRQMISNSNAIIENAYDKSKDTFDILEKAYEHLGTVSNLIVPTKTQSVRELAVEIVSHARKLFKKEVKPGLETPVRHLTRRMGGWRNSELIILAARPGMGKTAFALKTGWITALNKIPVAFFSLEMSAPQLMSRIISMDCRIENDKLQKDGLTHQEEQMVNTRMSQIGEVPFYIDDTSSLNIHTLKAKAKKMHKELNLKLIIVDYLQLMDGPSKSFNQNREREISEISRGLKLLAKELNVPVIALSQLSRAVETRGGSKRPQLSDLRESGAIEQDADVVGFIYRPEYYGIENWDDYEHAPTHQEAEYIIAKNRNGGLVRNRMRFLPKYTLFSDLDEEFDEKEFQPALPPTNMNPNDAFGNDNPDNDVPF